MIKFVNKKGQVYDGLLPYIHWFEGQQSTDIQYTMSLMVISSSSTLSAHINNNDIFTLVDTSKINKDQENTLTDIVSNDVYYDQGASYFYNNNYFYLFQLIVVGCSANIGQFSEDINITSGDENFVIRVGADFYGINEVLSINLENRGLDLPGNIQKAFYCNNLHEEHIDNILINRKFKELISNYLDVVDCRGSFKSLYNSLKWFEWGDVVKLYEIWGTSKDQDGALDRFFEKDMKTILEDIYSSLLITNQKTTYISLVGALHSVSEDEFDEEKNPIVTEVAHKWAYNDLYVKIVVLGAFFERYFMPIHLDLKRASMEAIVYTNSIKVKPDTLVRTTANLDDTGVVDIKMDHKVVLGNIGGYSIGPDTVFGVRDLSQHDKNQVITPVGVDPLEKIGSTLPPTTEGLVWSRNSSQGDFYPEGDIDVDAPGNEDKWYSEEVVWNENSQAIGWDDTIVDYDSHDEIQFTFSELHGNVGVVVPITVTIPMPLGDGINYEEITIYKDQLSGDESGEGREGEVKFVWEHERQKAIGYLDWDGEGLNGKWHAYWDGQFTQLIEKRLWMSDGEKVQFTFNLLSQVEEQVTFALVFHSISGHTWTAVASYRAYDTTGSFMKVCRVSNTYNINNTTTPPVYSDVSEWMKGNPYGAQYNITDDMQPLIQYIPTTDRSQLNSIVMVENPKSNNKYNTVWLYGNALITNNFWIWYRGPEDYTGTHKYVTLICKRPGVIVESIQQFINDYNFSLAKKYVKRVDNIFIPQLHLYKDIENIALDIDEQTGRYKMSTNDYLVHQGDLLCVIPQFKQSLTVDPESIRWEFVNKTTGEKIDYDIPLSQIMVVDHKHKMLDKGYWTVNMYYRLSNSGAEHKMTKNSAFKVI